MKKTTSLKKEQVTGKRKHTNMSRKRSRQKEDTDDMLNQIQKDKPLNHMPKSSGRFVDSKTHKFTASQNFTKERKYQQKCPARSIFVMS